MVAVEGLRFGQKFANFNVIQTTYKNVDRHGIRADILIPESLSTGKRPVIARFHGGGLVLGDSIYEDWFPAWLLELAESVSAIIVSANYRFLPEVTGLDILDDVDDFWSWLHSDDLKGLLASHATPIELDLDRVITAGDSAGGLLSVYLTLTHPDEIRAGTAAYPSLHWDAPPIHRPTKSSLIPGVPESVVDEHVANIKSGDVESSDPALQRILLASAISQHRRGLGFYLRGSESSPRRDRLDQLARLEKPDARLPRGGLVIIHGVDDDIVLAKASERFVNVARQALKDRQGGDKVVLSLQPGPHGFDVNTSLKEEWLNNALKTAIETWLE